MGNWDEDKRGTLEGAVQITGRHSNDELNICECNIISPAIAVRADGAVLKFGVLF